MSTGKKKSGRQLGPVDLGFDDIASAGQPSFPGTDRDLAQELFGKKGMKAELDALEKELGIGRGPTEAKKRLKYHNRVFSPTSDEDRKLLNALLNDKNKFSILMWKDSWTVHGDFRIFIVYSEDIDAIETHDELEPEADSDNSPAISIQ